ncbi:MAG: RNA polymerase sigma factor [Candidatus Paceibacterota bacterium]
MSNNKKLIKKAQKGEAEAFGKLYDMHIDQIYRYVFIRVSGKQEAEDITQKAFLKAWKNIHKYEIKKNIPFSSWLYRITKNLVIDYYRTNRDHVDIELVSNTISTTLKSHEEKTDKDLKIESVKDSLKELSEDEQSVLIMRFIDEMSNKEVAKIMNKSHGSVRVMQHRALKKLKEILDEKEQ